MSATPDEYRRLAAQWLGHASKKLARLSEMVEADWHYPADVLAGETAGEFSHAFDLWIDNYALYLEGIGIVPPPREGGLPA